MVNKHRLIIIHITLQRKRILRDLTKHWTFILFYRNIWYALERAIHDQITQSTFKHAHTSEYNALFMFLYEWSFQSTFEHFTFS